MSKVLIAEDDRGTQILLSRIVTSLNLTPVVCSDGEMAWNLLKDNPDTLLILTDMQMPRLSGRELIERVKVDESLSHIPFIIISGVVKLSEITDLLKQGASYFIPKPVNAESLRTYIERLIGRAANGEAPTLPV